MNVLHCDICNKPTLMADAVFLQDGIDLCESCWEDVQAHIGKLREERQPKREEAE